MIKLNPYLTLPGTAAQAIELYKKVFNVEPVFVQKFKDLPAPQSEASRQAGMPSQEGAPVQSAVGGERILHAMFDIGNDKLMLSDAPEGLDSTVIMGTQIHVSVHPESRKEADRIFELLSKDGSVDMPIAMQFWGDYFGMCTDKFGIRWMINYHEES